MTICVTKRFSITKLLSMGFFFVMMFTVKLNLARAELHDMILSPHPQKMFSGKYVLFDPENHLNKVSESTTKVPWEEPLKETANIALGDSKISKNSILKAPYVGFINPDAPTFGDIAVLAKGKLKKNSDKSFSFEQINERCDEKCQINADKYLENVTALWMVERIRHRDDFGGSRFDLKFTIVPIYFDQKHQIDHNILENRLKNHMKRTFILRDSDYPNYFQSHANRRMDLFSPGFGRGLSNLMSLSPNSLMQNLLGLNSQQSPSHQKQKLQQKDNRLNMGEFYMAPKIMNSKTHFQPTVNNHMAQPIDHRVRFPDSREMVVNKSPMNLYRPRPEIYNSKNFIDYRGANDNVFVGSSDHQLTQPNHQLASLNHHQITQTNQQHLGQPNHHQITQTNQQPIAAVPVFSIPVDMPIIQLAQAPYAFPFQIQMPTQSNQVAYPQQQYDVTTFRYHPQLIGLPNHPPVPLFNPYMPLNLVPSNKSKQFQESERHTMNYYSPPDPVYHHQQSTTEAPIQPSTYSPRFNNYANVIRHQVETPVISTASSVQVNMFSDNDFQPVTPSYEYDAKRHNQFKHLPKISSTQKPDSINAQLYDTYDNTVNFTIPYVTESPVEVTSDRDIEINYQIVMGRPKLSSHKFINDKPSEKPVLKWIPKKQRNKVANSSTTTPVPPNAFVPTVLPSETATQPSTRLTTHIFRGRNRFNKRNSSSANSRAATISPQISTKIIRRKTSSAMPISSSTPTFYTTSSVFPTYITPVQSTEEPITLQSLSTSISLEVNGERVFDPATTAGYELVSAGVESIATNNTNVKLFKASVVPEKFDDLTHSILNHAKAIESGKDEH